MSWLLAYPAVSSMSSDEAKGFVRGLENGFYNGVGVGAGSAIALIAAMVLVVLAGYSLGVQSEKNKKGK